MGAAESTGPLTNDARGRVLDDGAVMPLLGFGVWQVPDGPECARAVRWALEAGYRDVALLAGAIHGCAVGGDCELSHVVEPVE